MKLILWKNFKNLITFSSCSWSYSVLPVLGNLFFRANDYLGHNVWSYLKIIFHVEYQINPTIHIPACSIENPESHFSCNWADTYGSIFDKLVTIGCHVYSFRRIIASYRFYSYCLWVLYPRNWNVYWGFNLFRK